MSYKRYTVTHRPTGSKLVVDIDLTKVNLIKRPKGEVETILTADLLEKMFGTCVDANKRVLNNTSTLNALLKMLCEHVARDYWKEGPDTDMTNTAWQFAYSEGPTYRVKFDGTFGVKLVRFHRPTLTFQDDYDITEQTIVPAKTVKP